MYINQVDKQKSVNNVRERRAITSNAEASGCLNGPQAANEASVVGKAESVPSVLSIQENGAAAYETWVERGEDILYQLKEYYQHVLSFNVTPKSLQEMQSLLNNSKALTLIQDANEGLHKVVHEIETRLAIEVIKLERQMQRNSENQVI